MAEKICSICGKKSGMSWSLIKLRGKYNPTQKIRKYPNLQWVRLVLGKDAGKRVLACAKCIKAMAK
ncbi:MAG: L28 family ribosomal protein [Candidatus Staskawiczbacteria bacterium]|nr:L28 family ribosomal protein [Candidatus Staskawiczbacteria bacterium]